MGTIGYFILFFLVFLLGKFIYDSYLSNRTKEKWLEHNNTKELTDSRELRESIELLAREFNCNSDDYIVSICNQLEHNNTTVFQAQDMIVEAEGNILRESKNRGVKPMNTTSSLLVNIIDSYIGKIKNEVIEYEFELFMPKAKYFDIQYSKEYLGKMLGCEGWQVESKIENELRAESIENVLWALKKHKSNRIKEAKSSYMEIEDTPSGIIYELTIAEVRRRLKEMMCFYEALSHRASSDPFFKATQEDSSVLRANLDLFYKIRAETQEINVLSNQLRITYEVCNGLKKFFPKIEFKI